MGFVVDAKAGACGYAYRTIKIDVIFHKNIQHACGKESSHGAAF
jgi:hypothetical protein